MQQDYTNIFSTAIAILSAIITGGFVLIYVELSNKKTRETTYIDEAGNTGDNLLDLHQPLFVLALIRYNK